MLKRSWKKISSKTIVKHKIFQLQLHKVKLPSGKIIYDYVYIVANDGAIIIPITKTNQIILLQHYKYALNDILYTFPGGIGETPNEKPIKIAKRELLEETGYSSNNYSKIGELYTDPTNVRQRTTVFIAENCKKTNNLNLDDTEQLKVKLFSINKFFKLLNSNKIMDGPTLSAITLCYNKLEELSTIAE